MLRRTYFRQAALLHIPFHLKNLGVILYNMIIPKRGDNFKWFCPNGVFSSKFHSALLLERTRVFSSEHT